MQWTNEASLTTGSPAAILVRSYAAIPESCIELANVQYDSPEHLDCISGASCIRRTVLVGAVGLLGPGLVAVPLGDGLGGVGSIALAMPHNGLLNCPRRWVGRPVGVELRVIACGVISLCFSCDCAVCPRHTQQLVNVLRSTLAIEWVEHRRYIASRPKGAQSSTRWWGVFELTLEAICDILTNWSAFRALPF